MKISRKWVLVAALVLSVAMATSGTLAYLQDTAEDVNVMTLGSVKIDQHEYQRADGVKYNEKNASKASNSLVDFENGKIVLLPAVPQVGAVNPYTAEPTDLFNWNDYVVNGDGESVGAGNGLWNDDKIKNVVDKMVFVENTGKSDAYYRTIIAFECPEGMAYSEGSDKEFMMNVNVNERFDWEEIGYITIGSNRYLVMVATYNEILVPDEISRPSLLQVLMTHNVDSEKYELLGENYDIMVVSQAVQADGFADAALALDTAFGEPTEANVRAWFDNLKYEAPGDVASKDYETPTNAFEVSNSEQLAAALKAGEKVILLKDGEYNWNGTGHNGTAQSVSIYGESKNAILYHTNEGEGNTDYDFDGYTVEFYGLTISGEKNGVSYPGWARMSATYNDCVIKQTYGLYAGDHTFNYCTLDVTGDQYNIWTWGAEKATFNHCTFNSDGKAVLLYGTANTKLTINDCVFNDNGGLSDKKAAIEIGNDYNKSYELIVNNTIVNGYEENDKGILTGSTLWANKNSMGSDKLNVVIDGVDIY